MGENSVPGPACRYPPRAQDRGRWQNCPGLRSPTSSLPSPPEGPSAPWEPLPEAQVSNRAGTRGRPHPLPTSSAREARGCSPCCLPSTCPKPPGSPQKEIPRILFSRSPGGIIQGPGREGTGCVKRKKQLWGSLLGEQRVVGGLTTQRGRASVRTLSSRAPCPLLLSGAPQPLPRLQHSSCLHLCRLLE